MYAFADRYNIPHNKCGKLIVANSEEELASLDGILAKGEANGVHDLEMISSVQVRQRRTPAPAHLGGMAGAQPV